MTKLMSNCLAAIACSLLAFAMPAHAQTALVEGRDYVTIEPAQPSENPNKIEVVEYFSGIDIGSVAERNKTGKSDAPRVCAVDNGRAKRC